MNNKAKQELAAIKRELNSIINELSDISAGIKKDFDGIGSEKCSSSIDKVITQYKTVRTKLNKMDTTTVTEEYAERHGRHG